MRTTFMLLGAMAVAVGLAGCASGGPAGPSGADPSHPGSSRVEPPASRTRLERLRIAEPITPAGGAAKAAAPTPTATPDTPGPATPAPATPAPATPATTTTSADPALPAGALPVPLVRQAHPYSCGAAALLSVLLYWQVEDAGEGELYEALETTEAEGTAPWSLAKVAKEHALEAEIRKGLSLDDLRAALARGDTAILDLQAWREDTDTPWKDRWEDGHYAVLVAMDERNAYVMDPSTCASYAWLPLEELLERWHDCETRTGKRVDYIHAAIVIRGKAPLARYPAPPQRME